MNGSAGSISGTNSAMGARSTGRSLITASLGEKSPVVEARPSLAASTKPLGEASNCNAPRASTTTTELRPKLTFDEQKYTNKCTFLKRSIGDLLWENSILFERLQRNLTEANLRNEERRRLVRRLIAKVNRAVLHHRRALPSCIVSMPGGQHSIVLPSGASRVLLTPPERAKELLPLEARNKVKDGKDSTTSSRGRKKGNSDKRSVQPIPLDSLGRPIFPIELPGIEVHCLGEIDNKRPGYHTEDLLYPIGFCSSREFAAVTDPLRNSTLYTCTINDNGAEPKFEVSGDDNPAMVYSGRTPDEAVSALIDAINATLAKTTRAQPLPPLPTGKGAQFFGLSIPTIHHLIQGCLGTRKCIRYKAVRYETSRSQQSPSSRGSSSLHGSNQRQQQLADDNDVHLSFVAFHAKCILDPTASKASADSRNSAASPAPSGTYSNKRNSDTNHAGNRDT